MTNREERQFLDDLIVTRHGFSGPSERREGEARCEAIGRLAAEILISCDARGFSGCDECMGCRLQDDCQAIGAARRAQP